MKKHQITEIKAFLEKVDSSFPVPLSQKQNLSLFAQKLAENATIITKREHGEIVSMVAGYTENLTDNMAYISIAASLDFVRGRGYAKSLVKEFIEICKNKSVEAIHLYAVESNTPAVNMYKGLGFVEWKAPNESRSDDLHLIYYV